MIRAGVGVSVLADPRKAALEAADMAMGNGDLVRADMALFFCTQPHASNLQEISAGISRVTAAGEVVGCTGNGVVAGGREIEQSTALSVLAISSDQIQGKSFFIKPTTKSEALTAEKIIRECKPGSGTTDVGLLFPDMTQTRPEFLLNALRKLSPHDLWVGGCSAGASNTEPTYQAANAHAGSKAISGLCLGGSFHPVTGVAQGCLPIGKTYTITEAKDNVIHTLDGRTAYESLMELAKNTKLPQPQDPHAWIFMAIAAEEDAISMVPDGYYIRNILGVDPKQGVLAVAAHVRAGQKVSFALRDARMAREDLKAVLKRIKKKLPGPVRFGLYFACCARGTTLYRASGVDSSIVQEELGFFPLAGFFTYGEIGPVSGQSILHNYSGVLFLACE